MNEKILVLIATKFEYPEISLPDQIDIKLTGQGKINAFQNTIKHSNKRSYKQIINLGICGAISPKAQIKDIYTPHTVMQSDLFFLKKDKKIQITPFTGNNFKTGIIASQDSIVTSPKERKRIKAMGADIVDMESYAIARAAQELMIPFYILKIVSDTAEDNVKNQIKKNIVEYKNFLWNEFLNYLNPEIFNV